MTHARAAALAAMLLGALGCEGRRQAEGAGGMLADSTPPGTAADSERIRAGKPAPFPAEPVPDSAAARGGMAEDTAARRAEAGGGEKPVPMPGEPRPDARK
jgi:hypothetical protein